MQDIKDINSTVWRELAENTDFYVERDFMRKEKLYVKITFVRTRLLTKCMLT